MISRNVLARYPNVKVVVPHCGAYLPLMAPRMKSLTPVMQTHNMVGDIDWEANLAALYYDLAGAHSPEVIRMLLTITTPDHLLYGSDYPYEHHIQTAHFQKYKQGTLHMVKSLKLQDLTPLDKETINMIFKRTPKVER